MMERGAAEWGVYTAMVLMSLGSGGVKAVVSPFIGKYGLLSLPGSCSVSTDGRL